MTDAEFVEILRISHTPTCQYAADRIEALTAVNQQLVAALKCAYVLPRPWIDGGCTEQQWTTAFDAIHTAILQAEAHR